MNRVPGSPDNRRITPSPDAAKQRWVEEMLSDMPEDRFGCGHCAETFRTWEAALACEHPRHKVRRP
jgi:hypothetical protein